MKKKVRTTITLSKSDIEEILRKALGVPSTALFTFNLSESTEYGGYGGGYKVFKSVDVTTDKEIEI